MAKVKVITDSASDVPDALASALGISVVPLTVRFGDQEFVDRQQLSTTEFWTRAAASSALPETAAPSPGAFQEAFDKARAEGASGAVCVTLSAALSGTYQSAMTAASLVEGDFRVDVVDSRLATIAEGVVAIEAARMASGGAPVAEVADAARQTVGRVSAFATLDTLENLRKGGRIGTAQAVLGSMLSIKPVIKLVDGAVAAESRQRTRSKALAYLIEATQAKGEMEELWIAHADASDVKEFKGSLSASFPDVKVGVTEMGAVLGTHTGKGAMCLVGLGRA